MRGVKVIGTDASSSPIYKLSTAGGTDGSGRASFPDLEFDGYALTNTPGYDIVSACPGYPIPHEAGVDTMASVLLAPDQASTLRVHVMDGLGRSLPGIEVNLDRPGYDVTLTTDSCGQAFFSGGVTDDSDYVMTVGGTGYSTEVINPFAVSGDTQQVVTLFES
jgi:hypothetical protein